ENFTYIMHLQKIKRLFFSHYFSLTLRQMFNRFEHNKDKTDRFISIIITFHRTDHPKAVYLNSI
ncbi:hypothetical protein DMW19_24835, partial [Vibrio parahaemolyticus]|nr:hypothetical protein [Vibrio parahaemolyticus]